MGRLFWTAAHSRTQGHKNVENPSFLKLPKYTHLLLQHTKHSRSYLPIYCVSGNKWKVWHKQLSDDICDLSGIAKQCNQPFCPISSYTCLWKEITPFAQQERKQDSVYQKSLWCISDFWKDGRTKLLFSLSPLVDGPVVNWKHHCISYTSTQLKYVKWSQITKAFQLLFSPQSKTPDTVK